jgi:enediyne biosynthesis protein E4
MRLRAAALLALLFAARCKAAAHEPDAGIAPGADAGGLSIAFEDVTVSAMGRLIDTGLGVNTIDVGNGAGIGDLDGDGLPDVVLARIPRPDRPSGGPSMLLFNKSRDGRIVLEADEAFSTLTQRMPAYGVAIGDYDRDGRLDVFLASNGADHLLHNEGGGRFADVTDTASVAGIAHDYTSGAIWFDANDDGLVDLYVTSYAPNTELDDVCRDPNTHNRLYLNLGDGTFADVTSESGTVNCGANYTAAAADLDGDGQLELYLANDTLAENFQPMPNHLPKDALFVRTEVTDTGVPKYVNAAQERGVQAFRSTMGIGLADFDADGMLDIYLSNYGATQLYLWRPSSRSYVEAAAMFGLDLGKRAGRTAISWGVLPLDLDHDGALEVFLVHGTADVSPSVVDPDRNAQLSAFYRQPAPGMPFAEVTDAVGLPNMVLERDETNPHAGRGAYPVDLDRDGRIDVLVGAYHDDFRLYQNRTAPDPRTHFLRFRLLGRVSVADPVGARITVELEDGTKILRRHTAGGLTFGNGDFIDDIGLGARMPIHASIEWPSGFVQRVDAMLAGAIDREITIEEPSWLELSRRYASASDPVPVLTYRSMEGAPAPISIERSDRMPVTVVDSGQGVQTAELPHPGVVRRTRLTISAGGRALPIHPVLDYR